MEAPVPTSVPPQAPAYQAHVSPEPPVAVSVVLAPEQSMDGFASTDVGATGYGLTVTVVATQSESPQLAVSHRA